ncbi:sensor histidine kinase [Nocardia sp. CDC160]|uniref:sensor histidine kinase n=1 Tax=Nocardia sp. CDC160 TaxID=3112166 RepID=UPI002DBC580B|nr:nitrate- and nitrite sensing domain-containing protein [Nocardia sp. CDC160]MEC3915720.1 nitrate- and nitrite sensing domain-containing protein [Nocardia sp. CDC160]
MVVILLGATVDRAFADYSESENTSRAVTLALRVQDLTDQIQRELGLSNGLLGGDTGEQQRLKAQRASVDATLAAVKTAADSDAPGADQVRAALGQLNLLANTRTQIDTHRISRPVVLQFYNDALASLNRLALGLDQASDPDLQRGLQAFYALGAAKEQFDKERGFLNGVFVAGHFSGGEYGQFMEIRAAKQDALQLFSRLAGKNRQGDLDEAMRGDNAIAADQAESVALASGDGPLVRPVDAANWWSRMTGLIEGQRTVQQAVGNDIQARANTLRNAAQTRLIAFLVGVAIAAVAMIALVLTSVRDLVRPLAALAGEADDVASRRLPQVIDAWSHVEDTPPDAPEPVRTPPGASTEIAAVASALDRVQTTAFELASQQALVRRNTTESMGNLARRNQNLVRRQLALISEFEREELDPQGLANLFELDHLATRMRRNAESLLVLVGEGTPRGLGEPIGLIDVIRAGMSEVDDYRRVVLRRVEDVLIVGSAASELSHMLAELIENGLAYSPPDLEVEVYGRMSPQGYLLAVLDNGVGMSAEQLAQSNAKLRGEQDFIVASTRYLGHYVVGRLAQRLGISVELQASPVNGIVARLTLPPELLATEQDQHRTTVQALLPADTLEPRWGADSEAARATTPTARHAAPSNPAALPTGSARTPAGPAYPPAEPVHTPVGFADTSGGLPVVRESASPPVAPAERARPTGEYAMTTGEFRALIGDYEPTGGFAAHPSAPEPRTAQPPVAAEPEPGSLTTRNGLTRRNKRSRGTEQSQARPAPRPEPLDAPDPVPYTDRSPAETRSMLTSFRAGHERGATTPQTNDIHTRAGDPASTASVSTAEEIW